MKQAVILAGGKGTRLMSVLGGIPKPLVEVGGIPIIEHQIRLLEKYDFTDALILVHHNHEFIVNWVNSLKSKISIQIINDGTPLGTAGAVLNCFDKLHDDFLVMYADTMLSVNLNKFYHFHSTKNNAVATLFTHPNDHPQDSDLVELNEVNRVIKFHAYPHLEGDTYSNLVNAALYFIKKENLKPWLHLRGHLDFAKNLFPSMLEKGDEIYGYISSEYIKDAGTPERLNKVRMQWESGVIKRASYDCKQKAVFIDRDGTLNEDIGHIRKSDELKIFDYVSKSVQRLNLAEWRTILVTNQPVIARGEITKAELKVIHSKLEWELAKKGAYLDRILYCPHYPKNGFQGEVPELKIVCNCRKPAPGMIINATSELNIDLNESWLIGDSTADLGAAKNAGISSILVKTGKGGLDRCYAFSGEIVVNNFEEAVNFILDIYPVLKKKINLIIDKNVLQKNYFVGGLSRSGKTTFSSILKRELSNKKNISVHVVNLDRWIKSLEDRSETVYGRYDIESICEFYNIVNQLIDTSTIKIPWYDSFEKKNIDRYHEIIVKKDDIFIWEGVVALELANRLGHAKGCRVYMSSEEMGRKRRFFDLHIDQGGSNETASKKYNSREIDEHAIISIHKHTADFIISLDKYF